MSLLRIPKEARSPNICRSQRSDVGFTSCTDFPVLAVGSLGAKLAIELPTLALLLQLNQETVDLAVVEGVSSEDGRFVE
jgi:hypothetical protein